MSVLWGTGEEWVFCEVQVRNECFVRYRWGMSVWWEQVRNEYLARNRWGTSVRWETGEEWVYGEEQVRNECSVRYRRGTSVGRGMNICWGTGEEWVFYEELTRNESLVRNDCMVRNMWERRLCFSESRWLTEWQRSGSGIITRLTKYEKRYMLLSFYEAVIMASGSNELRRQVTHKYNSKRNINIHERG
jgi:hypothetical protein